MVAAGGGPSYASRSGHSWRNVLFAVALTLCNTPCTYTVLLYKSLPVLGS